VLPGCVVRKKIKRPFGVNRGPPAKPEGLEKKIRLRRSVLLADDAYRSDGDSLGVTGRLGTTEKKHPTRPFDVAHDFHLSHWRTCMSTIHDYKLSHCNTAGIDGLNQQILALLRAALPNDLKSCESIVNVSGASTLPFLQPAAEAALALAVAEKNQRPILIHAYRTIAHQHILYFWYQNQRCGIKLAARPSRSPHEQGIAIDIENPEDWIEVLRNHHWEWQGTGDPSHFTYVGSGINPQVRVEGVRAFQKLWNQHNPTDLIEEDGLYGTEETAPCLEKSPIGGFPEEIEMPDETNNLPWMAIAKNEIGVKEFTGSADNPRIVEYHAATTYGARDDEVAWCSSFVNWCMREAGQTRTGSAAARSWLNWGTILSEPRKGCVVVLRRGNTNWQGHVGFFNSDGDTPGPDIPVLGGNQGDAVSVSSFPKTRVLGYRWPTNG